MLKEYFVGLIYVCLLFALMLSLAHKRTRPAVSFGMGILLICTILLPLVDIIEDFSVDEYLEEICDDVKYDDVSDSDIELAFEEGIALYVAEEYGVGREYVTVGVDGFDIERLRADRIYVTFSGTAIGVDYKKVEADLIKNFTDGGECEVSLRLG